MSARAVVGDLGGSWLGSYGMARCPAHNDGRTPALKITDDPRDRLDFEAINRACLANLFSLLRRWLPDGRLLGHEYTARNPTRADRRAGSFRINVNTGKWADFATDHKGGDVVSLAAYLSDTGQAEAARALADMLGVRHD